MKKMILRLATLILVLIAGSSIVMAGEDKPTASADIGVFNKYVWRGYELGDDSTIIQPSTTISYKDFSFNLWGNLDTRMDDATHSNQFNEIDMTLSYDKELGPVCVGAGYIYYGLDGINDSEEIYLSIGIDTILSPTFTVYREIAHLPSWYLSFGLSHSFELPKDITLDLAGSVGYYYADNADDFAEYDSQLVATNDAYRSFHDGLVSIGLTIPVTEYITISPVVSYSFPLTGDADNHIAAVNAYSDDSDYVYGGATVSISF
ncbi:MAG: hypothetical protein KJ550_09320 [Proteobacteria bacterium]|nr:hypothetical protein [Desulfobacteraceae bacterium]MBU3980256.1 hypothetical protein [Pseudomonadota bacterium]MBU4013653.1 hypothetical protein [Pseudomonadota bacterium]MBU4066910.1 hypothetical protein [Pseudomonadota bacterium]MBU4099829.1 hypothetical protein [Pseudomonadota bacterium]